MKNTGPFRITTVNPKTNFKFLDAFTDKDEKVNPQMPGSEWSLNFSESDGVTKVKIVIKHKTLADLENIINMGFKEGFTMTLGYLATLLAK